MKMLVVVDMQNDFINGVFGTPEAQAIVPAVCDIIEKFYGPIYATIDVHPKQGQSIEEKTYAPHCLEDKNHTLSHGARFDTNVANALNGKWTQVTRVEKSTFAWTKWNKVYWDEADEIHIIGVCTDICVLSNALVLRSVLPKARIIVHANACAGTTPEHHEMALEMMRMNCIEVIDDSKFI